MNGSVRKSGVPKQIGGWSHIFKAFEIICHSGRIGSSLKEKQVQKTWGINMIFFFDPCSRFGTPDLRTPQIY